MKIGKIRFYGGARDKVCRLGLAHLFLELLEILVSTEVRVLDRKQANGAARVREMIDERFGEYPDWVQSKSGDVDWTKRLRYNELREAKDYPIVLLAVEHDGYASAPLPKKVTNRGKS